MIMMITIVMDLEMILTLTGFQFLTNGIFTGNQKNNL